MPQHPRVQEILVDRGQLVFQDRIQMLDNGRIASHRRPPQFPGILAWTLTFAKRDQSAPLAWPEVAASLSSSIWRTNGTHLPHCGRQPQARYTIETEEAPPSAVCWRRTRSVRALHRHMYTLGPFG
jgi:hypothetical protein